MMQAERHGSIILFWRAFSTVIPFRHPRLSNFDVSETNKKLIETTERIAFDEGLQGLVGEMPLAFRVTTVGAYHIERWTPTFAYLDTIRLTPPFLTKQ
ncbi:MAG: hypothetical protein LUQ11_16720 [Methylococcaceae bacterium]|nr:hypothetical protein [Methylococcaceae bacterium]